jgi:hypothetical protein
MCGQQGVAGYVGMHRAIAQDDMRQDGEDRFTPRTLDAPDGETAQPDPDAVRVASQAPTAATGGLMRQLRKPRTKMKAITSSIKALPSSSS